MMMISTPFLVVAGIRGGVRGAADILVGSVAMIQTAQGQPPLLLLLGGARQQQQHHQEQQRLLVVAAMPVGSCCLV
jgi:hypothetical protein